MVGVLGMETLLLDLRHVKVRDGGVLAIENARDFLKRRTLGLYVEEVDDGELDADPELTS